MNLYKVYVVIKVGYDDITQLAEQIIMKDYDTSNVEKRAEKIFSPWRENCSVDIDVQPYNIVS